MNGPARFRYTQAGSILLALLLVAGAAPAIHGQSTTSAQPSVVVTLEESGTADVRVTLTYDLESDSDRQAFRELQNNRSAQEAIRERFQNRMTAVARDASATTGRAMTISDASITLSTTNSESTGIVKLGVTYEGFAAVSNGEVAVTEPFVSGFESDRPVVLIGPSGSTLQSSAVAPDSTDGTRATWQANRDFSGFHATFALETSTTDATQKSAGGDRTSSGDGPGFGVLVTIIAVLTVGLLRPHFGHE